MALRTTHVARQLTVKNMSQRALHAEYAVRGPIAVRSNEIDADLAKGKGKYNFKSTIKLNTGNPQNHEQRPFAFPHQVAALLEAPQLIQTGAAKELFPTDVIERAEYILKETCGVLGAYTATKGFPHVRREVAKFIEQRDNTVAGRALGPVDIENIFISNGASGSATALLTALIDGPQDGLMIPIPQYPLYTATLALLGGTPVPYYPEEEKAWAITVADLEASYAKAKDEGVNPKAVVIINPGNPTGQVLDRDILQGIVDWAHKRNVLIVADEVYQENIYAPGKKFWSIREVVLSSKGSIPKETQVVSLHTVSKGMFGECGRRGGYMELLNIPNDARAQVEKLLALQLSPNNCGQIMVGLMCNRPKPGDASYESFNAEYNAVFESLKVRAKLLVSTLRELPGVTCNDIEGAMYAFPNLKLPPRYCAAAADEKVAPDFKWCMELLEQQGVVTVPGSGFGQKDATHHVRLTILPPKVEMDDVTGRISTFHKELMSKWA
jgi:alanine transaminase